MKGIKSEIASAKMSKMGEKYAMITLIYRFTAPKLHILSEIVCFSQDITTFCITH